MLLSFLSGRNTPRPEVETERWWEVIGEEVGRALRRTRLAQGLTLREVGIGPAAVQAHGGRRLRAGRAGHLAERFCALCTFYGVEPE